MKIVVTGSSGFIGTKIVKKLHILKHKVIELDIHNNFDITDWNQISSIKNFDVLIHLAAKTFVPDSYRIPRQMYNVNVLGTLNMLELCRINNAKMLFASSYVYGKPKYLPIDENHPTFAFNPYCQSKIIGEELCKSYNKDFGVLVIIFRPFNIYGAGQNDNFLIPLMIKQIKDSGKLTLKDPRPKRDFIHVNDVVEAYIKVMSYRGASFEIFNLGSGSSFSVKEIAEMIVLNSSEEIEIEFSEEKRKNEVLDTIADITKIKQKLNWNPNITLNNGIKELIDFYNYEK